jgi:SAM-dependent methyltransferase
MLGGLELIRRVAAGGSALRGYLAMALRHYDERPCGTCPCCGYTGRFAPEPHLLMAESCPQCGALERQRLLALAVQRGFVSFAGADVLHFAPDPSVMRLVDGQGAASHVTADYAPGRAELVLNIESLDLPGASFDRVICSHVLEHVDDHRALREIHRVLRPGGQAVIMLPIVEGWSATYENPAVRTEDERTVHFGQYDHVRYFGADLRGRIADAGFALSEYTAEGADTAEYRLQRGEKVFLAAKP